MANRKDFNIFSADEQKYYLWLRKKRDDVMKPVAVLAVENGLSPSMVSFIGVLFMVPFVLMFSFNPWLSFIFLLLSIFCDSLDGVMARISKKDSASGALVDFVSDFFVYLIVFFTLLWYGLVGSFWGAAHVVNYLIMQFFILYANFMKIDIFPAVRSKFLVYLVLFIWLAGVGNFFDPFILLMTVYMMITNLFLFFRIKWALS